MPLPNFIMRWLKPATWNYAAQGLDFGFVLPLIARLPLRWAYRVSDWRGAFNARYARDWTEMSVGFAFMGAHCAAAFREIFPQASAAAIERMVVQRYQTVTREELEGMLAIQGRLDKIKMDLAPVQKVLAQRKAGRGLVVVMSHFDNLFLGLLGIARCGQPVYLMTSDIVQDARVHPTVRRYFKLKYQRYEEQLGGGKLLPTSSAARDAFYRVLRQGGVVVVISEAPASQDADKGTWVSWMGQDRKMTDSALRMAIDTESQIVGMRNRHVELGRIGWQWTDLIDTRDFQLHAPERARELIYAPIFAFLEDGIKADPGRWWAAHLLGNFVVRGEQHGA